MQKHFLRSFIKYKTPSIFCLSRQISSTDSMCDSPSTTQPPTSGEAPAYVKGSASIAYITAPDGEAAKTLARGLIENKLAACVNIIPNVTSIYRWEGKLQEDSEVMMIVKTLTSRVDALSEFVRRNHSYEVAEVISTKIENGNDPYLRFLENAMK